MALGFCYGRTRAEEKEKREKTYGKVQEMLKEFQKDFGTIQCQALIQLNLMDPADRQKFQDQKLIQRCSQFVAKTAEKARGLDRARQSDVKFDFTQRMAAAGLQGEQVRDDLFLHNRGYRRLVERHRVPFGHDNFQ